MGSAVNLIMSDGRTLLSDDLLDKLVVLRMNKKYMERRRERNPKRALQLLTARYDKERDEAAAATSSSSSGSSAEPIDASTA